MGAVHRTGDHALHPAQAAAEHDHRRLLERAQGDDAKWQGAHDRDPKRPARRRLQHPGQRRHQIPHARPAEHGRLQHAAMAGRQPRHDRDQNQQFSEPDPAGHPAVHPVAADLRVRLVLHLPPASQRRRRGWNARQLRPQPAQDHEQGTHQRHLRRCRRH